MIGPELIPLGWIILFIPIDHQRHWASSKDRPPIRIALVQSDPRSQHRSALCGSEMLVYTSKIESSCEAEEVNHSDVKLDMVITWLWNPTRPARKNGSELEGEMKMNPGEKG